MTRVNARPRTCRVQIRIKHLTDREQTATPAGSKKVEVREAFGGWAGDAEFEALLPCLTAMVVDDRCTGGTVRFDWGYAFIEFPGRMS